MNRTNPSAAAKTKRPVALLIVVLLAGGVLYGLSAWLGGSETEAVARPTYTVERGPLTISVSESGSIRARDQEVLINEVEGRTTILYLIPEGTMVEEGELLVELDASSLQDEMIDQEIQVQNAEAAFVQARENLAVVKNQAQSDIDQAELDFQFAKEDLIQYEKGEYPKALMEAEANIELAREELHRAEETLKWSKVLFEEKLLSQTELQADELAANKAALDLKLAEEELALLKNYTYKRNITEMESNVRQTEMALERTQRKASADIVQASADLRAKDSEFERQKSKLAKLEEQLAKTKIYAPQPGMAIYATSAKGGWRGNEEPLDEGREVREREELIYLPRSASVIAEAKIHEAYLDKVTIGMPVRVTVDALPGRVFRGTVEKIAPLPDATSVWLNPDLKVYTTQIGLEGDASELRTGMSCQAEIIIAEFDNVLYIPVQTVIRDGGDSIVYVQNGSGFEKRVVELGPDNNRMAMVEGGLEEGEQVLMTPPLGGGPARVRPEEGKPEADGEREEGGEGRPEQRQRQRPQGEMVSQNDAGEAG